MAGLATGSTFRYENTHEEQLMGMGRGIPTMEGEIPTPGFVPQTGTTLRPGRGRGRARPFGLTPAKGIGMSRNFNGMAAQDNTQFLGLPVQAPNSFPYLDDNAGQTIGQDYRRVDTLTEGHGVVNNAYGGPTVQQVQAARNLANDENLLSCNRTGVMMLQRHGIWPDHQMSAAEHGWNAALPSTPPHLRQRLGLGPMRETVTRAAEAAGLAQHLREQQFVQDKVQARQTGEEDWLNHDRTARDRGRSQDRRSPLQARLDRRRSRDCWLED